MSIPVPVEDLPEAVDRYGPAAFLLTTSDDDRPHATQVAITIEGTALRCELGRRTARNGRDRPKVSLLWPPIEAGGHSLIVDGDITVSGGSDDTGHGVITPTRAVLHRPAPVDAATADAACGSDCHEIEVGS